jgi:tetratricopeptide (TPR) repeat protein
MLLDFNLALERDALPIQMGGTLPYMSPEQIEASVLGNWDSRVDARSDVFSLGVLLYELLAGTQPFASGRWTPILKNAGQERLEAQRRGPRSLRASNPQVDAELAGVVERCLALDPAARWQSAGELAEQLSRQLGRIPRTRRWLRSHRKLAYSGVLLTAVLASGIAGYAASLDPYWLRQYQAARTAYAAGDYAAAIERLNLALEVQPNDAEMLVLRARSRKKSGEYTEAAKEFRRLWEQHPDPKLLAERAYCFNMSKDHFAAVATYREAMDQGHAHPRVLHNLAMSYLVQMDPDNAAEFFTDCIAKDRTFGMAYFGRTLAALRRAERDSARISNQALDDIRDAIERLPKYGEVFGAGARVRANLAADDPSQIEPAFNWLKEAVSLGFDATRYEPQFKALASHPRYQEILQRPRGTPHATIEYFLDPDVD